jgi:hypothetical protein
LQWGQATSLTISTFAWPNRPGQPNAYNYEDLKHIVRHLIRPFGIAHGSEKQGGQHEGGMSPVTWPVNLVIMDVMRMVCSMKYDAFTEFMDDPRRPPILHQNAAGF